MDVCGFCGVAPRGPARVPVINEKWPDDRPFVEPERPVNRTQAYAVESFTEYQRLYGSFDGPGLLPYAVASFFEQGGRRAYIARIVHDYGPGNLENAKRVASGTVPGAKVSTGNGDLVMRARNEGLWGNRLRVALSFQARPISFKRVITATQLALDEQEDIPAGTLLRLTMKDGTRMLRFISAQSFVPRSDAPGRDLICILEQPTTGELQSVEVVTGTLLVDDGDGRTEEHIGFGLSASHPRWLATVLCNESSLLFPDAGWINAEIRPNNVDLANVPPPSVQGADQQTPQFNDGEDGWADITPDDFIDDLWQVTDEAPGQGIQCFAQLPDLAMLAVPDLYLPIPLPPYEQIVDPVSFASADFQICVEVPPQQPTQEKPQDALKLQLDPHNSADLQKIVGLQKELVKFADAVSTFVLLLDVPPGLTQRSILDWRTNFDSSYAACYYPWLQVSRRDDSRDALIEIPPSAVAAGIIAASEIQFGIPTGPANVLAAQVVNVEDVVSPARHDALHPLGINVYLRERDGVRLTAARTLSRNRQYRQLSVRRLMTMIRITLQQQMQWAVFEPNNAALRLQVRLLLENFLHQLFRQGAFRGATEEEAFFVRCDDSLNPPYVVDAGRLIAEIGVAPSEPIEFILLRLAREGDGTLSIKE